MGRFNPYNKKTVINKSSNQKFGKSPISNNNKNKKKISKQTVEKFVSFVFFFLGVIWYTFKNGFDQVLKTTHVVWLNDFYGFGDIKLNVPRVMLVRFATGFVVFLVVNWLIFKGGFGVILNNIAKSKGRKKKFKF